MRDEWAKSRFLGNCWVDGGARRTADGRARPRMVARKATTGARRSRWDPGASRAAGGAAAPAEENASDDRSPAATLGPGRFARSRRRSRPGGGNTPTHTSDDPRVSVRCRGPTWSKRR